MEITEQLRNKYFFMGDGNAVKGLFNNKDLVDITAQLPTSGDVVNWISVAFAYLRQVSLGIVKPSTILVSPKAFAYLNNYKDSSDKSYYTKVSEIVTDTPGGNPQTLKIIVLDILSTTVSSTKPLGDVYFLTNNPKDYRYFYQSMLAGQFVPSGARYRDVVPYRQYQIKFMRPIQQIMWISPFKKYQRNIPITLINSSSNQFSNTYYNSRLVLRPMELTAPPTSILYRFFKAQNI